MSPVDYETIIASVEKTGRMVFVQEAQRMAGVGNTKSDFRSFSTCYFITETPISFVAAPDTVYPFAQMENEWLPNAADITKAIY